MFIKYTKQPRKIRPLFAVLILLAIAPLGVMAQDRTDTTYRSPQRSNRLWLPVLIEVRSTLKAEGGASVLELPILDQLAAAPNVSGMELQGGSAVATVVVRFQFRNMQEFRQWHRSTEAIALLRDLKSYEGFSLRLAMGAVPKE